MATYIVRHRAGWKYKRAVPPALHAALGRKQWTHYIKARTKYEAEEQARALAADHDRLISKLKALTHSERIQLASDGGLDIATASIDQDDTALAFVEVASGIRDDVDEDRSQEIQGTQALEQLKTRKLVARMKTDLDTRKSALRKLKGIPREQGLHSLVTTWERIKKPRSRETVQKMTLYLDRFIAVIGSDLDPKSVARKHVIAFRDHLEGNAKYSHRTACKHLEQLHTLFAVAMSQGVVDANPAHGVKVDKRKGEKLAVQQRRRPFSIEEVALIFDFLHTQSEDFQWVVRLLAYHGARSNEISQLRVEDVTVEFGVPVLKIHDRHGSIKNAASVRDIPLHPACHGFLTYAKAAGDRAAAPGSEPWVFQNLPQFANGRRGSGFQRDAADFLRKQLKIKDKDLTMHSLRHTWRTLAREMDMPVHVSRAIMGHSMGNDDHAGYGAVPSLKVRAEWLAKINPLG